MKNAHALAIATVLAAATTASAAPLTDLQARIDATARNGGGRVSIPAGEWEVGKVHLRSGVELHLDKGAVLSFSDNPDDYLPKVLSAWQGEEILNYSPLVYALFCTNVAITGQGVLTTRNSGWNAWFKAGKGRRRPPFIQFFGCGKVRLEDFAIRGTPFWTVHLYRSEDVRVRGIDVSAFDEKGFALMNSDGLDIECSRRVHVSGCSFRQGDDAIVLKSGRDEAGIRRGLPTEDVLVENCVVHAGHCLFGIGSEVGGGIRRVRMRSCRVEGDAHRLLFVKTNAKRGGFIEEISMEDIVADRCGGGIVELMADYWYYPTPKARILHRTPIRGVSVKNVRIGECGSIATLRGDPELPARDFTISGVVAERVRHAVVNAVNIENLKVEDLTVLHPPKRALKPNDPSRGGQEPDIP